MNICEGVNSTNSLRSFADRAVASDVISKLITLGTKAAASSGQESWSFAVIAEKNELKRLSDETRKHLLENLKNYPYFQQYESRLHNEQSNIFYDAPCLLLIYADSNHHRHIYDVTLVASNIMQDAREYGLSTCWIGFAEHVCDKEELKLKYMVPEHYKLVCALSVGYPIDKLLPQSRKSAKVIFRIDDLRPNILRDIV